MRKHTNVGARIALAIGLLLSLLSFSPIPVSAHTEGTAVDPGKPCLGTHSRADKEGVHPWIISEALAYLRNEGAIDPGSWFDTTEFEDLLRWGAWYADNTGRLLTVEPADRWWAADAQTHFYIKNHDIYITDSAAVALNIFCGFGDYVHTGNLVAPEYSAQLYQRAVEFWPGGAKPLDLSEVESAGKPYSLGWVGCPATRLHYRAWGHGVDPDTIWRSSEQSPPPQWPWWAANGESVYAATIYLGWTTHLVQDLTVYYHVHNLHGSSHLDYEKDIEKLVRSSDLSNSLPINDKRLVNWYCEDVCGQRMCLDLSPNYYADWPVTYGVDELAHQVAESGGQEFRFLLGMVPCFMKNIEKQQLMALDAAVKATAALIYKFMYDVSGTVYVDPSNAGIRDGSMFHPFGTIAEAIEELTQKPTKTTIKLSAGVYSENVTIARPCVLESATQSEAQSLYCNQAVVVDVSQLNLRPQPTKASNPIVALGQGSAVCVLCENLVPADEVVWVKVNWQGTVGWMSTRYLLPSGGLPPFEGPESTTRSFLMQLPPPTFTPAPAGGW